MRRACQAGAGAQSMPSAIYGPRQRSVPLQAGLDSRGTIRACLRMPCPTHSGRVLGTAWPAQRAQCRPCPAWGLARVRKSRADAVPKPLLASGLPSGAQTRLACSQSCWLWVSSPSHRAEQPFLQSLLWEQKPLALGSRSEPPFKARLASRAQRGSFRSRESRARPAGLPASRRRASGLQGLGPPCAA